jgi:L-fuconolactonase
MRIDAHQHFWKYDPRDYAWIDESMAGIRKDFLPVDLETLLKAEGFDGCIAVQARQSLDENRFLLDLARPSAFVRGVVGWVDLKKSDVELDLADFAGDPKAVGIRHIAQAEPDDRFLAHDDFVHGVRKLAAFDLTYDILVYPRQLPAAIELVAKGPDVRFVLDHCGKPEIRNAQWEPWATQIRELAKAPNVSCKISGLVTEANWAAWTKETLKPYVDHVVACFGAERCMLGSDWPVCLVAGEYARVMGAQRELVTQVAGSGALDVMGKCAERVYLRVG